MQDTADKDGLPKLKERAAALKALRERKQAAGGELDVVETSPAAAKGGGKARQRKLLVKVHGILTKTPQDARGFVEGTQFTVTGVERLMTLLKKRASEADKPGVKAAQKILGMLAAKEDDTDVVASASVGRLQALSSRVDKLKKKRLSDRKASGT
jgi:hypothetical protein